MPTYSLCSESHARTFGAVGEILLLYEGVLVCGSWFTWLSGGEMLLECEAGVCECGSAWTLSNGAEFISGVVELLLLVDVLSSIMEVIGGRVILLSCVASLTGVDEEDTTLDFESLCRMSLCE